MKRKIRRTRTGTRLFYSLIAICALFCSCSTAQKINVKQSSGDNVQETTIEHSGKLDNLSLSFVNCSVPDFTACR